MTDNQKVPKRRPTNNKVNSAFFLYHLQFDYGISHWICITWNEYTCISLHILSWSLHFLWFFFYLLNYILGLLLICLV
jgi:hypothetical protein